MKLGLSQPGLGEVKGLLPEEFFVNLGRIQFDMVHKEYGNTMRNELCKRFHDHKSVEEGMHFNECVGVKACEWGDFYLYDNLRP